MRSSYISVISKQLSMSDDDNINLNFSEICRLCLTREEHMLPIFDNKAGVQAPPLPVKIMTCASVKVVAGDGLPELICHQCAVRVDSWYRFKKQCQKSDATLRRYISTRQSVSDSDGEEETATRGLRTRRKQTTLNTQRREIAVAKEAAIIERKRSAEARIFANDLAECDVEEVPVYPDLPCEVKVEGEDDERTEGLDEDQSEENSELLPPLPINKGFPCKVCHRSFSSKSYLRDHQAVHSGERSFSCLECGKAFYSDRKLTLHVRTHSVERPCLCSVCGKAFREKSDLKKHFRLHSDESPFLCNVCGKTFKTKFYLTRHLMIHSGEKRHSCAECGKAFTWRDTLMAHAKVHARERPLACSVCNKGFKRKEDLVRHIRIHTGEKPFVCPYCERPFSDKWNLTQHLRLHTGQKPYVCSVCSLAFTHNVTLRNHMKQHQT